VTAEGAVLLDVAGLLVPPLLLGALAGRLLGIEVQRGPGALSGLAGSALEVATSEAVTDGSFIAFGVYAIYSAHPLDNALGSRNTDAVLRAFARD
jgi:hypothetical protein